MARAVALCQPHGFTPADLLHFTPADRAEALVEALMTPLQRVQVLAVVRRLEELACQ